MYYHCIVFFDIRNLVLCLTHELIKFIDYNINSAKLHLILPLLVKKIIKIEQESTLELCFLKMWFYMKHIVKYYSDRILFARLCTFNNIASGYTEILNFIHFIYQLGYLIGKNGSDPRNCPSSICCCSPRRK